MSKYLLRAGDTRALVLGDLLCVRVCVSAYWGVWREGGGREAEEKRGLTPACLQYAV